MTSKSEIVAMGGAPSFSIASTPALAIALALWSLWEIASKLALLLGANQHQSSSLLNFLIPTIGSIFFIIVLRAKPDRLAFALILVSTLIGRFGRSIFVNTSIDVAQLFIWLVILAVVVRLGLYPLLRGPRTPTPPSASGVTG